MVVKLKIIRLKIISPKTGALTYMWWWWSDKDNDVPALHALIEPLYPLMASLVPVLNTLSSFSTFSSSDHDNHNLTKIMIIIMIKIIVFFPIPISSFSQVLCYPLFRHLSSNSLPVVKSNGLTFCSTDLPSAI